MDDVPVNVDWRDTYVNLFNLKITYVSFRKYKCALYNLEGPWIPL